MKFVIDIPKEELTVYANDDWNIPLVLSDALKNATPLEEILQEVKAHMWNCRGKWTTSIDKVKMESILNQHLGAN